MFVPMMKKACALLALAALASCGGGGGGGGGVLSRVTGIAAGQVLEGNSGSSAVLRFVVSIDRATSTGVRVVYSTASTGKGGNAGTGSATGGASCAQAGADYVTASNADLTVPAGATTGEILVTVCGDATFEPNETLAVNWFGGDNSGTAIGTIVNDDAGGLNGTGVAGSFGRDSNVLTNSDADGRLGFSFAKVPGDTDFQCTRDNVTGLLWEGKAAGGGGLHDATRTYTYANLAAFVAAVNAQALCGSSDWRLPTPEELASLLDSGTGNTPTIDAAFFPATQAGRYWTSTSLRDGVAQDAWLVDFSTGTVGPDNKGLTFYARLVTRGGTSAPAAAPTACTDTSPYTDHGDGTVSDKRTGLMWKRCAEGFAGASCVGTGSSFEWEAAQARAATVNADATNQGLGYSDWRLPTRAELSSITEREQCFNPAANTASFPNNEPLGFWTSTAYALNANLAWAVDFFEGDVAPGFKSGPGSSPKRVRLVRAGQ